mmetsp:Transcript_45105/g.98004  ORF Transcript_45105/g.98004 Transcript_45105/m.98004 type:complete len:258 (+) Transcript_45105:106-879(+)
MDKDMTDVRILSEKSPEKSPEDSFGLSGPRVAGLSEASVARLIGDEDILTGRKFAPEQSTPSEGDSFEQGVEVDKAYLNEVGQRRSPAPSSRRHKLWLHIYDLDPFTARLNEFTKTANLGCFHCGVEVLGEEWFFAWGETSDSGVAWNEPKRHQVHIYRESLCMGKCPLSLGEIERVLCRVMDKWPADSYHPISRNCISFAEELLSELGSPEPFPAWVRGVVDVGKSAALFPIADFGWKWVRWWNTSGDQAGRNVRS